MATGRTVNSSISLDSNIQHLFGQSSPSVKLTPKYGSVCAQKEGKTWISDGRLQLS